MLLPSDLKYNLKALQVFTYLGILPVEINENLGRVSMKTTLWAKLIFKLWQLITLIHILQISFQALVFFSDETRKLHHLPIVILTWGNVICVAAGALITFDVKADHVVKSFTELFVVLRENQSKIQESKKCKGKMRKIQVMKVKIQNQMEIWNGKNIYELNTIYTPFLFYPLILIIPVLYVLDPDVPIYLISNFSPENRTPWIFGLCLCLELTIYVFHWAVTHFVLLAVQSFIHSTRHSIRRQIKALSDEGRPLMSRILDVEKMTKIIALRVNLFNLGYSSILFILKLEGMEFAVGGGFGALLLFNKEPIFTGVYGAFFVAVIIFYMVIFNRAFDIETTSEELKLGLLIQSQRFRIKWKREEYKRMVRAICPMGIKVGGFYKVEREAVPIFTDFVIQQIIGLLLV